MKNKSIFKGAAAIAVGGALLLGGGGTLAWWNAADTATPGTIASGDLNIVAQAVKGVWTDRTGQVIPEIDEYLVVPGDKLTFSQELDITLEGERMVAELTAKRDQNFDGFDPKNVTVSAPTLSVSSLEGAELVTSALPALASTPLAGVDSNVYALEDSGKVTASITFEFLSAVTTGRLDVNKQLNLGTVSFALQQVTGPGLL